jgi:hypothetical protein
VYSGLAQQVEFLFRNFTIFGISVEATLLVDGLLDWTQVLWLLLATTLLSKMLTPELLLMIVRLYHWEQE